ncbi:MULTISPECIES: hypothetical protein [unclassified Providencia]|uniref:hypothetical protein n=1 Tax=unclassified Providencia TaxID=2633465 RepID=UPI00234B4286|nr:MULTISPECIES: hypothetical protein [unclassified Providencia]
MGGLYNRVRRNLGFQLTTDGKPIETTSSGGVARDINDIQNDTRVKQEQRNAALIVRIQRNIEKQKDEA